MKKIHYALLGILIAGSWIPQAVLSKTLTLINSAGERACLEVGASDQFLDVLDEYKRLSMSHAIMVWKLPKTIRAKTWQPREFLLTPPLSF